MSGSQKVMIVEGSNSFREEIKLLLEKLGLIIIEAAGGTGLFNVLEEYSEKLSLIVLSTDLKDENGFDLVRDLKGIDDYMNIPVIMLSEAATVENVMRAKELGVAGYFIRPVPKDEFTKKVKMLLKL